MARIDFALIVRILGMLLLLVAPFMLAGIPASLYYGSDDIPAQALGALITAGVGALLWFGSAAGGAPRFQNVRKREGYIIASLGWVVISACGALPFVLHGSIPHYADAFFESMSGFTTTGATILDRVEDVPPGLLFWRALMHWLGGMGIIVLTLALLPLLGVGGAQLFRAESSASRERIHPQVTGAAKRLWGIYAFLTLACAALLVLGGMSVFDAICHAFATVSTGGFSTKTASVGHWDSAFIHYTIIVFMFLGGTNFALHYQALHGKLNSYVKDEEFRFYCFILLVNIIFVGGKVLYFTDAHPERSFRDAAFQVVSIVTSTGFITADYESWSHFSRYIFLILLFTGACAGSTCGSIKMIRILSLVKNGWLELTRLIHPRAVLPVRINGRIVENGTVQNTLAFFVLYIFIFLNGSLVMSILGLDLPSALGAVAATLGGMGPGIGTVGPTASYASLPELGKWFLSFLMLLGRLEIFTILVLFSPAFWRA